MAGKHCFAGRSKVLLSNWQSNRSSACKACDMTPVSPSASSGPGSSAQDVDTVSAISAARQLPYTRMSIPFRFPAHAGYRQARQCDLYAARGAVGSTRGSTAHTGHRDRADRTRAGGRDDAASSPPCSPSRRVAGGLRELQRDGLDAAVTTTEFELAEGLRPSRGKGNSCGPLARVA